VDDFALAVIYALLVFFFSHYRAVTARYRFWSHYIYAVFAFILSISGTLGAAGGSSMSPCCYRIFLSCAQLVGSC